MNAVSIIQAISVVKGMVEVGNYGTEVGKMLYRNKDSFNIIWVSECETIHLIPNTYTEICAAPSFRLYINKNQLRLVIKYAYKMKQLANENAYLLVHKITFIIILLSVLVVVVGQLVLDHGMQILDMLLGLMNAIIIHDLQVDKKN